MPAEIDPVNSGVAAHEKGDAQRTQQLRRIVVLPAGQRAGPHQHDHQGREQHEHGVEPGETDRDFAPAHGVVEQRGEGTEEHQRRDGHQQQVVTQQHTFARHQVEAAAAQGVQRQ
jgi:hypothetical protein